MDLLKEMFSLRGDISWPARFPDLSPCDYFLSGYLKSKVYKNRPRTTEELTAAILEEIAAMTKRVMKNFWINHGGVSNQEVEYSPYCFVSADACPNFLLHNQISFEENHIDSGAKATYTDGSKTDEGTGSAYCILENYGIIASWQGKLDRSHSVFQAEILATRMAIEAASSLHRPIKIGTDSLLSLMAILNPKSHLSMVREIQTLLLSHKHIHLRWLKAHVGYLGNECADQLAKEAITKGDLFFLPKSLSYLKAEIKSAALSIWQDNRDNGETGRSTHDIVPRVSNKPVGWNREEIMFVTGHGPFPSYLLRFNLRTHDNCSCGEKGDPIHYATKCRLTLAWHFQTPTMSLKLQWLKHIFTNNLSRSRLRLLMRFICDENNLIVEDNH
ncbi:hypothetical protein AVEN_236560-1 [Araneus ventricosus]|uniref:RNase H type-1 domain-containing protein n=1 Tax=Araneus ventricosus TaxID=182803 RepID=A0A4Y2MXM0_ARAVE|nr:hypothetical protein AVEN_236560-1 [Araneus ventricosus]